MEAYNDSNYINIILDNDFSKGYKLYLKCLDLIRKREEKELNKNFWDLYLIEAKNGSFKGSFDDYLKEKKYNKTYEEIDEQVKITELEIKEQLKKIPEFNREELKKNGY